jgi:two-component SAPR family response regulator
MAHQSLATTLHRLRKALGYQEAVQLTEGRLTLDPRYCWVDVWGFERMLGQADVQWGEGDTDGAVNLTTRAVDMYKGPFLGGETEHHWMIPARERLRSKLLRNVARLGKHWQQSGQWESALEYYKKGLEVDNLAEEFYQCLMTCYQSLGRKADAIATYRTCQKTLSSMLCVEPSPKTEAIYRSLLSE